MGGGKKGTYPATRKEGSSGNKKLSDYNAVTGLGLSSLYING